MAQRLAVPGSEWSLIAFTLLAQAGVGTLCAGEIANMIITKRACSESSYPITFKTRLTAFILSSAALGFSFLHLGSPLKAINAFNNLRSSWLSREILTAVVFLIFLTASVFLTRRTKSSNLAEKLIVTAACSAGLFLILAMSFIYMLPGVITWDNITTPFSFFTSVFLLGFMATAVLTIHPRTIESIIKSGKQETNLSGYLKAARTAVNATFILASFQVLLAIILSLRLQNLSSLYSPFESSLLQEHRFLLSLRIVFMLAGMGLILLTFTKKNPERSPLKIPVWLLYPAFTLILLSEILGRSLFYSIFLRAGL